MPFPFTEICVLFQRHEDVEQGRPPIINRADRQAQARAVTESWFKSHRSAIGQLNVESLVALLSTLLPERRTDRVYNIGAARLVHILSRCIGLSASRTKDLRAYTQAGQGDLAQCLERVLTIDGPPARPPVTLDEVDEMLQILASGCRFSDPNIQRLPPGSSEARDSLIGNLIKRLHPHEAKWLVRLIMKDLTPVRLNENEVLKSYHFLLPGVLRFQHHFDAAVRLLKGPLSEYPTHPDPRSERLHFKSAAEKLKPTVGVKIGRPHFHKARSIDHCMRMLGDNQWVLERKYDGEYCEIHIDLAKSQIPAECITVFSKSGKNSTDDRKPLHSILVETLRLGQEGCRIKHQAILLGEMVVYSDREQRILPFDEIRKHVLRSGRAIGTDADSCPKVGEHLSIVFFDILLLDNEIIMDKPVDERRQWLREVYRKVGGKAIGAEWKTVNFGVANTARRLLMQQFAASIAQRCEGLLLKPCGVPYFSLDANPASYSHSYIKLKKDYLADMGDEADFAVVGGSYSAQQAASSGVAGIKWTDFHLGCLVNKAEVLRFDARPRFKVVGSIQQEHCISKPVLQAANALGQFCAASHEPGSIPANFDLDLAPGAKIGAVFNTPFIFEVLGSGFEKPSNCNFSMLRHPRVTKLHEDRTFKDAVSMQELQKQASAARSAAADSESQETRQWLAKLEKKSRRKFERERTGTPKTRTTATPSTTVMSTGRTRVASTAAGSRARERRAAESPQDTSALDGTTLVGTTSSTGTKGPRRETSQTPCPMAKRQRFGDTQRKGNEAIVSRMTALADITNQAPLPSASVPPPFSNVNPSSLKRLSGLFKPPSGASNTSPSSQSSGHCPGSALCPLYNSTLHLAPCIARTPYIANDLLSAHLVSGCIAMTPKLKHWEREAFAYPEGGETVAESPAWKGRKKVLLVESKRREATRTTIKQLLTLRLKGARVELWDWRVLEDAPGKIGITGGDWFLGALEQDPGSERMLLVEGVQRSARITG